VKKPLKFDTIQVHGGYEPSGPDRARAVPICQSTSFVFRDAEHAASLFAGEERGHIYSRMSNPTIEVLENRISLLEGGVGTVALASGSAAILASILTIARCGDEIVSSRALYGGTTHLFASTLRDLGITVRLVDINDLSRLEAAFSEKTRAVFTETIGNPMNTVADLEVISRIAHAHGVPLIVDGTVTTPWLLRPFEHGADIVVHSLTKFMGGHGVSIGGSVTDSGRFSWDGFEKLSKPDQAMNGIDFSKAFGERAYIERLRAAILRDAGPCMSPFNAFTFLLGIETLSLRMQRHCENAMKIASFLEGHDQVAWVNYPGLAGHPDHGIARKYLEKGFGAVISFAPKGGYEAARQVVNRVRLVSHLANIGDARSLIIHPASTTHHQLSAEQQASCGITPDMVRISVGIEDVRDILDDLDSALRETGSA
jgi:O-acetylhomoserine (thiol)-lyase